MSSMGKAFLVVRMGAGLEGANAESIAAISKMGAGDSILLKEVKQRSLKGHNFFFQCVDKLYKTLPESHDDMFSSADEFRAWSQCKAGLRNMIPASGLEVLKVISKLKADAAAKAKAEGNPRKEVHVFGATHDGVDYVVVPKTLNWEDVGGPEFQEAIKKIDLFWQKEFGVSMAQLRRSEAEDAK